MRNTNSLMENMKLYKGSHPFVDLAGDLAYKKDYSVNSWFYTSRFQVEGQDISTLVHLISLNVPGLTPEPVMLCMVAATNETTGEYYGGSDEALPFSLLQVSDDKYDIRTPTMYGDLDEMHVKAEIYGGAGAIDFTMKAVGWPIFNSGNAHFPIGLMNVYQYSLPTLATTGTLTLGDKTYQVEGTSWYDRQWQNTPGIMDAKWAWMNMDMDNGDFISIWDIDFIGGQRRNSFATILKPDGTQMVVPAEPFGCAGWCHFHLHGSMEGFRRIRSPKKWLRAHREFEWPDTYNPANIEDLTKFYDRYLKGIRNGWEFTPRVRLDVMDAYEFDYARKREENEFPLKRTQYKKLYLNAANASLNDENPATPAEVTYDPEKETVVFDYKFDRDTEITGYMKLRLYCECRGHDNMDLFVWVKKLSLDGEYLPVHCMKEAYRGAWGYCRVSRRGLDERLSTDFQPVQAHQRDLKLSEGEIVPVDAEIWPHSRFFHKGESLRVEVAGRFIRTSWHEDAKMGFHIDNAGTHVLHTGGEQESYLQIPVIPPKYQVGDYIYKG